jgi:hypothetical protein
MTDRVQKLDRIAAILDTHGADSLQLTTAENLAWFFDGARVAVPFGGPPVFTAAVQRDRRIHVSAFANEVERLSSEELGSGIEVESVPWVSRIAAIRSSF